jgi:hypothetical protein
MTNAIRKLVYVPILHAREDVGNKAGVLQGNDVGTALARDHRPQADILRHSSAVGEMWAGITAKIEELNLPWNKTRIYQDGLPVSGKELEIVTRLTDNGSWNHLLILNLLKKGAKLEGTENMDFLMREYDLLNILLMKNSGSEQSPLSSGQAAAMADLSSVALRAKEEYQAKSRELLKMRDEFILNRIKTTLQEGEVGIIFMGVMHRLDKMLEKDFLISYVIYRLPFRSVGAIYNA